MINDNLEFVVCGQLMPIADPDPTINLETRVFKENEALLCAYL